MEWAKLNVFQQLVQKWESLHPYNGVQALRLAGGAPAPAALTSAWRDSLASLGLGQPELDGQRFRFIPESLSASPSPDSVSELQVPLESVLVAELNHRYGDAEPPLRPFIVRESDGFWLGIAYRHWLADSVAIRRVLREWYARLFATDLVSRTPLDRDGGGYWKLFGPGDVGGGSSWTLPRGLLAGAAHSSRMKRVQRIESRSSDFTVGFNLASLPDGAASRIRAWAKRRGYKVNDVLLAALAEAITLQPLLTRTPRRQELALGTIVDLRPSSARSLADTFGLYLGFTTVFLRPRHYRDFSSAVARIAKSHAICRANHIAQASLLRIAAGIVSHRYLPTREAAAEFYRKRIPLAGGTSNVLLVDRWLTHPDAGPPILDYVRASPTGPMMPIVLGATTLGSRMQLGLTRRTAIVPDALSRTLLDSVTQRLASLSP